MKQGQTVSVLLVDDCQPFRQGVRTLLGFLNDGGEWHLKVVGEAASADQAIQLAAEQDPRLILLDLELAQGTGLTVLDQLAQMHYQGHALVLSVHHEEDWIFQAMQAGAHGYVYKDQVAAQLPDAIRVVLNNQVYLSPDSASQFFRLFRFYSGRSQQACQDLRLTEREQEVLHWLVQGASNEAIAQHLCITIATVKAHLTAIFDKLSVKSRTQAIVRALKLGLVSP